MAKKKKLTKEEISGPDAFQSLADRASKSLSDNWKPMAAIMGALLVVGIGLVAKNAMDSAAEEAAQSDIYPALKTISDLQREISNLENPAPPVAGDKKDKKAAKETEETDKEKIAELNSQMDSKASQLLSKIESHKGTKSAEVATLNLSGFYISKEKYQKAVDVLSPSINKFEKGSSNYAIVRSQMASALSYLGETEKAMGYLQQIVSEPALNYFHGDALVKIGILHLENKDYDKAKNSLLRAKTEFSNFTSGRVAAQYLRWIDYSQPKMAESESSGDEVSITE